MSNVILMAEWRIERARKVRKEIAKTAATLHALYTERDAEASLGSVSGEILEAIEVYKGGYSHEW